MPGVDSQRGGLYTGYHAAAHPSRSGGLLWRVALRLACWQAAAGAVTGGLLWPAGFGPAAFPAALCGALIVAAGSCCVAGLVAPCAGAAPGRVLNRFRLAECAKWALVAGLFLPAFKYLQSEALPLLIGFIAAQFAAWPAFLYGTQEQPGGR